MTDSLLRDQCSQIGQAAGLSAIAIAVGDAQGTITFEAEADRWFHAASLIKAAVLFAVFDCAQAGSLHLREPLHVRNRFSSLVDGSFYRIESDRDGDGECHGKIGQTMAIGALARAMIVRSSNLATNLLLELIGLKFIEQRLQAAGLTGIRLIRGVEDHRAHESGMNNEITARGALGLFHLLCESAYFSPLYREEIRAILLAQEFNSMIPALLPAKIQVAHKTGEISTHCHDAGVIYRPGEAPYGLAVLTESAPGSQRRAMAIARISAAVHDHLTTSAQL